MRTLTKPRFLSATMVLTTHVQNVRGENLGKLEALMLDLETGRVVCALVSFEGLPGLGNRLFAMPWGILTQRLDQPSFVLNVDQRLLARAPSFPRGCWPQTLQRDWLCAVYTYYGYESPWE